MAEDPPFEGNIEVKRGHACFIPGGRDWFISLGDHPEWETSHPVWGLVDEWSTVDAIVSQNYSVWTSADGIPLRILSIEVPFKLAAEGDHTYGARSAPLP
ncbi:peptidyl-prolyl cis-cyclophilin type [Micractinium conductrix]|uniref:Peptidyl-prolyl cis-cyclophilin type n=1 Tax=Micractinium conductrix TaxID=554055 RepID=A0A2P6V6F3_9CHLO|nr:peptidyl-prolyl cis-cyclophilin type [Micractinium conductrix]|eukprot:PSC69660.1 peptidyl-prolyl cis-cyclophilin type [Micractinium conductrix]